MKKKLLILIIIGWISGFNNIMAQAPGNTCATATNIPLPALGGPPAITGDQTTQGSGNNYSAGSYCESTNYGGGEDGVYTMTVPPTGGVFTFSFIATSILENNTWKILSIHTACVPTTSNCINGLTTGTSSTGSKQITLSSGTYYLFIDTWPTPNFANFNLSISFDPIPPPPPPNQACNNATPRTINPDFNCGTTTAGTIESATNSGINSSCSGTPNDDVWYTFVATNASHTIDLLNVTGSTTDLYHAVYAANPCTGSTTTLACSDPNN